MYDKFIDAIHKKNIVEVQFSSKVEGVKTRKCIPFDYGPWRRNVIPNPDRYHFYDLDSPDPKGSHNLSILPDDVISIENIGEIFEPGDYIKWQPKWFIQRDWGIYS